jgi:hypothetical protein
MVRHWNRALRVERDPLARRRIHRSRVINGLGAVCTALVLVVVLATKFTHGAYLVVIAIPVLFALMSAVRRHYDRVSAELEPAPGGEVLPARIHAVVLVSRLHRPTLRAVAFARATHPATLTAVTVATAREDAAVLQQAWGSFGVPVPLTVLDSPYRDITGPLLDYVAALHRDAPRDVVAVYIPEYVVGHWWENLLHNQSALRFKARLLFQRQVMVISVPWQLRSSRAEERQTPTPTMPVTRRDTQHVYR